MRIASLIALASAALAAAAAVVIYPSLAANEPSAKSATIDARTEPPLVAAVEARRIGVSERAFTGTVSARVQSNLGFRVPGKIVERFVDTGDQVKIGQPLMRIDERDLRLALTARSKAADAARAMAVQARADERRYATLLKLGQATRQRYEQAKAALDSAEGQLAAAQAEADVARNEAGYAILVADSNGSVVETLGEPGQVVSAGQAVVRLAHDGQREATVSLPETVRPAIGSAAEAHVYGLGDRRWGARLRQLSSAADTQTRTFDARFVLDGEAAEAPIGSTVTVWIGNPVTTDAAEVPIGAILDENGKTGVWSVDRATSRVSLRPVTIMEFGEETVTVSGLEPGTTVAALGAHLLHEGAAVRLIVGKGF